MKTFWLGLIMIAASFHGHAVESFLTPEDIETFYTQGFVVKRQCIEAVEIARLDEGTKEVIQQAVSEVLTDTYPSQEGQQVTYINGSQLVFRKPTEDSMSIARIVGCGGIAPQFLDTLRSSQMVVTFFNLLGVNQIEHIICQFHPKQPNDGVQFFKHRDIQYRKHLDPDWQDVTGKGSYAICILAIDPMSAENGGLYADMSTYPPGSSQAEQVVALELEPGDLLFMHPELLHWSLPNNSSISRRVLLSGFCAFGANHKPYPGTAVNEVLTLNEDGTIDQEPAPWKQTGDSTIIGNH